MTERYRFNYKPDDDADVLGKLSGHDGQECVDTEDEYAGWPHLVRFDDGVEVYALPDELEEILTFDE